MPRLSANEAEDSDYMDPFMSGPNFFETTTVAASTKESVKTKTTTSSTSTPAPSTQNELMIVTNTSQDDAKSASSPVKEKGRESPDPIQTYYKPPVRGQSKRISRVGDDDVKDRQVGGERRLFVVNASSDSEE